MNFNYLDEIWRFSFYWKCVGFVIENFFGSIEELLDSIIS